MIHFLSITIQEKGIGDDYRAFLDWMDSETRTVYQIRGYGDTPGKAADDAYARFEEDKEFYTVESWVQE
jgi:hypothetical protein